jgi:hypothetical protein
MVMFYEFLVHREYSESEFTNADMSEINSASLDVVMKVTWITYFSVQNKNTLKPNEQQKFRV